MATYFVGDL
ncbi:Bis(5'-nucleosyl)-tetraphosphatase, symmetrical, partial [Haemophilus influenzae]